MSRAKGELDEITSKLSDIDRISQAPKVAALKLESPDEITNRVSAARQSAGLPQSALLEEQPLDPTRIARTDFEVRTTNVKLASTTLGQLIAFCDALNDEETGTMIRDLTLTVPQNGAGGGKQEKWNVQLVLTQMIFSPTSR